MIRIWAGVTACAEARVGERGQEIPKNRGTNRRKKSLVIMLLVLAGAAMVQQSVAQAAAQTGQPTQKKEIKDPAEYNAYVNAIQQQNPAQKAAARR